VGRRIAAIAAVRIRSITVRLDLAIVRAASLAGWTGRELDNRSVSQQDLGNTVVTYSTSLTGTNVVRCSNFKAWVAHEDGRFDVVGSDATGTGQSLLGVSVAAESIVEDLTSLVASCQ
jgi:hypothetical protein